MFHNRFRNDLIAYMKACKDKEVEQILVQDLRHQLAEYVGSDRTKLKFAEDHLKKIGFLLKENTMAYHVNYAVIPKYLEDPHQLLL